MSSWLRRRRSAEEAGLKQGFALGGYDYSCQEEGRAVDIRTNEGGDSDICRITLTVKAPRGPQARFAATPSGFLNTDLGALLLGLPKLPGVPDHLKGFMARGGPLGEAMEALRRTGAVSLLVAQGWSLRRVGYRPGVLDVEAQRGSFQTSEESLETLRGVGLALARDLES
ncbi:MAG: hypothetical protein KGL53_03370 [Elusimicrobia bacterium]|nr:hypothetical protein [Elusimicrobiota bacterium]